MAVGGAGLGGAAETAQEFGPGRVPVLVTGQVQAVHDGQRRGRVTGLLASPISWTHHWVWAVPLLVWLATAAWRRRSAACALAAAAAAAVFSSYTPLPWPGHPPGAGRMAASDLYVLFGLAAVGVALARGRPAALAMAGAGDSTGGKPAG